MKKILILTFLWIAVAQCNKAQDVPFDGVEEHNGLQYLKGTDDLFTGKTVSYHPNGKKAVEISYIQGKENGTNRQWYANGTLQNETQIKDGKLNGLWIDYYENGKKEQEITYEDDYMNGKCTRWYENGKVKEQGQNVHCREEGLWIFYYENGLKKEEGAFHEAQKTGLWKEYDEQGKLVREINYN